MNNTTVVSVGILLDNITLQSTKEVSSYMQDNFKYYEIIVIASASSVNKLGNNELNLLQNFRFIVVNVDSNYDLLRKALLDLAIGDVVILFDPSESHIEEIDKLVDVIQDGNDYAALSYRKEGFDFYTIMATFFYKILSFLSGMRLDSQISNTCAFSRSTVNCINALPNNLFKLRQLLASDKFSGKLIDHARRLPRTYGYVFRQISASVDILGASPFRLLKMCSAISIAACFCCLLYFLYTLAIWIFKTEVQSGWVTTSIFQSVFFGILFFAFFLFSCIASANAARTVTSELVITRDEHGNRLINDLNEINVTSKQ